MSGNKKRVPGRGSSFLPNDQQGDLITQMANLHGFRVSMISMTTRFVQGYRYLDRCGEALVRLEDSLEENWIPGQIAPKGGSLKNDLQQMVAQFDSEHLSVTQSDLTDFEAFHDAACRIYETLIHCFEIRKINAPVLRAVAQKGCDSIDEAEAELATYRFGQPHSQLASLIGQQTSFQLTYCAEEETEWNGNAVHRRRRFNAAAIRQIKQLGFDDRLLKRVRLLPDRQREALRGLVTLRKQVPDIPESAVQIDLEQSFETELTSDVFDIARFLSDTCKWLEEAFETLTNKQSRQ